MSISQGLLAEFDHETETTRKALERIPEDKFGWKPHEKSMTLGRLSQHLAELPGWGAMIVQNESMDMKPGDYQSPKTDTRQAVLEVFNKNSAAAHSAIAGASDQALLEEWALSSNGQPIFKLPRVAALRTMILSHIIHHRGQLSVYLRLNNVAVPSMYGPTADEGQMAASSGD